MEARYPVKLLGHAADLYGSYKAFVIGRRGKSFEVALVKKDGKEFVIFIKEKEVEPISIPSQRGIS